MPGAWEIKAQRDNRILVAVIMPPDLGVSMDFAQNLSRIQLPPGSDYMRVLGLPWGPARNQAAKTALENGYNLAFLDADIRVPPDGYMKLWETGLDLVSGLYFQRFHPFVPVAFSEGRDEKGNIIKVPVPFKPGDLVPATFIPAGLLLVRRAVLGRAFERFGGAPFVWGVDTAPVPDPMGGQAPPFSEDFSFSYKCKTLLGVQPYVHTGVVGLHEVRGVVGPRWVVPMPSPDPLHGVVGVL